MDDTVKRMIDKVRSINHVFEEFNFNPENNINDKRELEDLGRQGEGKLAFEYVAYLASWLFDNPEIDVANKRHDAVENQKIPRLRRSSLDAFKDIVYQNIRVKDGKLFGVTEAAKQLSNFFGVDDSLAQIELGKLAQKRLPYTIVN